MGKKKEKIRKIPMRTCVFCRKKMPKKDMIRMILSAEGNPVVDSTGKLAGRGANLCPEEVCFEGAIKKGTFERVWKMRNLEDKLKSVKVDFLKEVSCKNFRQGNKKVVLRVDHKTLEKTLAQNVVQSTTNE